MCGDDEARRSSALAAINQGVKVRPALVRLCKQASRQSGKGVGVVEHGVCHGWISFGLVSG